MIRYKHFLAILLALVLVGVVYIATLRGSAGNPTPKELLGQEQATQAFELSPERGRFAHVVSLSDNKTYALNNDLADFVYPDVGWYKGKFYSFFAPGMSYMASPFYLLGKHFGLAQIFTFGFVSFVSLFACLFIFLIARNVLRLPIWASILAVFIFAFGSTALSYAVTLYQHHVTVFFILSTFYATWKYKQAERYAWTWAVWVWAAYALAIAIDYPNAVLLLPVMIYFALSSIRTEVLTKSITISFRWTFIVTSIAFLAISSLHMYHNAQEFGSWKRLSGSVVDYKVIKENNLQNKSVEEITESVAAVAAKKGNVARFFSEKQLPNSFGTLMFSKDRGLLFYGPIFVFGFLGILLMLQAMSLEIAVLLALVGVNIFLYSSWGDPWGGWSYGTRYLIPSMSVLSLFASTWLVRSPKAWISRVLSVPFFAYSLAVALVGVLTTNAVPPRVEATALHSKFNYLFNIDFLKDGRSGSFLYNSYFHQYMSLVQYFEVLFLLLLVIFCAVVIFGPVIERERHA